MDELRTGSICVDLGTPSSGHQRSMSTFRESAVSTPASLSIENAPMIAYTAISLLVPTRPPGHPPPPPQLSTAETPPPVTGVAGQTSPTIVGPTQAHVPPSAQFSRPTYSSSLSTLQESEYAQSTSLMLAVTTQNTVDVSSARALGINSATASGSESANLAEAQSRIHSATTGTLLSATSAQSNEFTTTSPSTGEPTITAPRSTQDTGVSAASIAASSSRQVPNVTILGVLNFCLAVFVFLLVMPFM